MEVLLQDREKKLIKNNGVEKVRETGFCTHVKGLAQVHPKKKEIYVES